MHTTQWIEPRQSPRNQLFLNQFCTILVSDEALGYRAHWRWIPVSVSALSQACTVLWETVWCNINCLHVIMVIDEEKRASGYWLMCWHEYPHPGYTEVTGPTRHHQVSRRTPSVKNTMLQGLEASPNMGTAYKFHALFLSSEMRIPNITSSSLLPIPN